MDRGTEVKWKESLSVGYAIIDGHHKKLVRIVEDLRCILDLPEVQYRLRKIISGQNLYIRPIQR